MENIFEGSLVRLRGIEPGDWEAFYRNDLDTEGARTSYFIPFPRSEEGTKRWTYEVSTEQPQGDRYRFGIEALDTGLLAGSLTSTNCDRRNGTFSYGIGIFPEQRRRGYAHEAILLLLHYFFAELRYQKCNITVYDFNVPSLLLHRRLGFIEEGRLRRNHFSAGVYHDEVLFGLTFDEFQALWSSTGHSPPPLP